MNGHNRPFGITVLAILNILLGILYLLTSLGMFVIAGLVSAIDIEDAWPDAPQWVLDNFSMIAAGLGALFLLLAIIALVLAYGFLKGRRWAWWIGVIFAFISIVSSVLSAFVEGFNSSAIMSALAGMVIPLLILAYLMTAGVKSFFGR